MTHIFDAMHTLYVFKHKMKWLEGIVSTVNSSSNKTTLGRAENAENSQHNSQCHLNLENPLAKHFCPPCKAVVFWCE